MNRQKIIFVYNANSSIFSSITDSIHKVVSPDTYKCNLCKLTYGSVKMKKVWKEFVNNTLCEVEFIHKDESQKKYPEVKDFPSVFTVMNGTPLILVNSEEINNASDLPSLISTISNAIKDI